VHYKNTTINEDLLLEILCMLLFVLHIITFFWIWSVFFTQSKRLYWNG